MLSDIDDKFFPPPSHRGSPPNLLAPRTWPGVSPASTAALQAILTDNHKKWHIFFNDRGFHNHTAHAALTLWSLGAHETILQKSYQVNAQEQRPAFTSPNAVSKKDWKDYLGDERYYQAYLEFFKGELQTKSISVMLEEYIFSTAANFVPGANKQPEMLNRFMEGLLHPLIHTGFGVEFALPGTFAEGLAQAAVHGASSTKVIPETWFNQYESLSSRFANAVGFGDKSTKKPVHAFTVLARILADPIFVPTKVAEMYGFYKTTVELLGDSIKKYVDEWTLEGDLEKSLEQLIWVNTLIYGVGGSEEPTFNADFFHMHLVTSSVFLSSIFSHLKPSSQVLLLRSYFAVSLGWYIGRGRPALDIAGFFKNPDTVHPKAPGPEPTPHKDTYPSATSPHAITPDPWLAILQSAATYPDDHLPKLQRALSEHASHFGSVRAGTFAGTELKDAELIDGSLFIRTAGLTANRMGWVREGEAPLEGSWDRRGFFKVLSSKL
ncbi:Baeyer-Villiger oxidase ptaJ [Psilocybe cubensis]|uniref:Baeyer-Villiger oxidase ptaJ n=2 Tax=Psilocybe cubensis TaxID=181762 RepID=A0ACB8H446_PSICU|nr:Baeyer-Villiger oxidase ptaJ [Psilocybe cubensis]KAH9482778.1 Baeyer-Villiger oxidase ptaJ [Psilocybe cubensis]